MTSQLTWFLQIMRLPVSEITWLTSTQVYFCLKIACSISDTNLSQRDPRWVGAWWLGFIIFGACAILMALPISLFPASLKKTDKTKEKGLKAPKKEQLAKDPDIKQKINGYFSRRLYIFILLSEILDLTSHLYHVTCSFLCTCSKKS